jgi:hypothetical protein
LLDGAAGILRSLGAAAGSFRSLAGAAAASFWLEEGCAEKSAPARGAAAASFEEDCSFPGSGGGPTRVDSATPDAGSSVPKGPSGAGWNPG